MYHVYVRTDGFKIQGRNYISPQTVYSVHMQAMQKWGEEWRKMGDMWSEKVNINSIRKQKQCAISWMWRLTIKKSDFNWQRQYLGDTKLHVTIQVFGHIIHENLHHKIENY